MKKVGIYYRSADDGKQYWERDDKRGIFGQEQAKYHKNPRNEPNDSCKTVGAEPIFLAFERPLYLYADRAVLLAFGHIVADNYEHQRKGGKYDSRTAEFVTESTDVGCGGDDAG